MSSTLPATDADLFALVRQKLFPALVGDVLDKMGLLRQYLPQGLQPLRQDMVLLGRAMPVLECDYFAEIEPASRTNLGKKPFGLVFEALDSLKPHEVYVAAGGSLNYAMWGGLMSVRATHLRAAGALLDGFSRDTAEILELGFPVFSRGQYGQDQGPRGKVVDCGVTVAIGGITIRPGDIVFGDRDGVIVLPREAEKEALTRALEKATTESQVRLAIEKGMPTQEAFDRFGVM